MPGLYYQLTCYESRNNPRAGGTDRSLTTETVSEWDVYYCQVRRRRAWKPPLFSGKATKTCQQLDSRHSADIARYFLTGVTTPIRVWCNKSATSQTRRLKMQETSRARSSRVLRRRSVAPRLHFRCLPTPLQLLGLMSRLSRFGQTRDTVWKTVSLFHTFVIPETTEGNFP